MEKKYKRIPFDLELAKAITKGEKEGRVVTRGNYPILFISFNILRAASVLVVYKDEDGKSVDNTVYSDGRVFSDDVLDVGDLFLEVPDEQEFEEGYVVVFRDDGGDHLSILKSITDTAVNLCALTTSKQELFSSAIDVHCNMGAIRLATPEERQQLIDVLKKDNSEKAREYLKRFFGIKVNQKFKPFDKVLVRDNDTAIWQTAIYSHYDKEWGHMANSKVWDFCIPYNEQTKHLLGTTDDWEG